MDSPRITRNDLSGPAIGTLLQLHPHGGCHGFTQGPPFADYVAHGLGIRMTGAL